jgi:glycine betaine/proline transport system substrate-binding protein
MNSPTRTVRHFLAASLALFFLGIAGSRAAVPEACRTVRMATPGWTDIESTNAMAGVVLDALGYKQNVRNLSVAIVFQGLKTDKLDVFLGNWMPSQKPVIEKFLRDKSIDVLGTNLSSAKFTLAVPSYVAKAGVHSFADLARYGDKFNHTIYGIEPGAPGNLKIKKAMASKTLGLSDWRLMASSETGMLTQVGRAVRARKWIVFLAWEPHLMNAKFDLTYLKGGDAFFGPNYGSATVYTVARHGYARQCPNLGRLFGQMAFSIDTENRMIAQIIEKHKDPKAVARQALKKDPAKLAAWLDGVTTSTGKPGLPAVRKALGL